MCGLCENTFLLRSRIIKHLRFFLTPDLVGAMHAMFRYESVETSIQRVHRIVSLGKVAG